MNKFIMTTVLGELCGGLLLACSSTAPIKPVSVVQADDVKKTCQQLSTDVHSVEQEAKQFIQEYTFKRTAQFFVAASSDAAMTLLAGKQHRSDRSTQGDFNHQEQEAINQLQARYSRLLTIAETKQCDFIEGKKQQLEQSARKKSVRNMRRRTVDAP